jgi:hypothetical protein
MIDWVRKGIAVLALIAGLLAAAALGYAQAQPNARPLPLPVVLSGSDLGFRVEGQRGTSVVGRFVVRVNGAWIDVDARFEPKVVTRGLDN